jgi:hypothetical protein
MLKILIFYGRSYYNNINMYKKIIKKFEHTQEQD